MRTGNLIIDISLFIKMLSVLMFAGFHTEVLPDHSKLGTTIIAETVV